MTSSLGRGGPSPSELVGARTTCTRHPSGASRSSWRSPSGVSAQFFDVAARSTTRSRVVILSEGKDLLSQYSQRMQALGMQTIQISFCSISRDTHDFRQLPQLIAEH